MRHQSDVHARDTTHPARPLLLVLVTLVVAGCATDGIPDNPIDKAKAIKVLLEDGKNIIVDVRRQVSEDQVNDQFNADRNIRQLKLAEEKFHRAKTIDPESFTPPRLLVETQVLLAACFLWKAGDADERIRAAQAKGQRPDSDLIAAKDKAKREQEQYLRRANNEIELYLLGLDRANAWREAYIIMAQNYEMMEEYDKCIETLQRYKRAWRPSGDELKRVQVSIRNYQERLLNQRNERAGT